MKAIVVGRHTPSGNEGIEIVGNEDDQGRPQPRPINFPATAEDCRPVLKSLVDEAINGNCYLLFQAIPVQLAVAISCLCAKNWFYARKIGGIVNVPGPRPAGVETTFWSHDPNGPEMVQRAVRVANPRAVTEIMDGGCKIIVDPPLRFEFSHIQWFDGSISNMSLRGFFARFGLPLEWIDSDGDIMINEGDSAEVPKVNDGDETAFDASGVFGPDVTVEENKITFKAKSQITTDFFSAEMVRGDSEGNISRIISAMNEAKDNEGETWPSE